MTPNNSIVFINQNAGYLMIDIVSAHREKYRQRAFITGKIVGRNTPLDANVQVKKIITYDRTSTFKRLFTWFWGFIQILYLIKTRYHKSALFIVSNPPFAPLLPLFCKNKFSLLIYDVYPDALVEYKFLKKDSTVIKVWKKLNKKIYSRAENIYTIGNGMKQLLSKYVAGDSINVVPVWTDNNFLKPVEKKLNHFISKHHLQNKFLVIYSGNIGLTHDLEVLLEVASNVNNKDIYFVIIGEGKKKKALEGQIKSKQIKNCLLLPWQEVEMLPYSLSAADLGVVSLGKEASLLSVPSKTYNLMSVGVPLLCIASQNSELASLVNHYQLGQCFDPSEIGKMISFIENLASDNKFHQTLKEKVLVASKEFGPENVYKLVAD